MRTDKSWQAFLRENQQDYLSELLDLLRIPSISTSEANVDDVMRAASWVAERMNRAGVENVTISPTGAHACVTGDWLHAPGRPTILIYGHFDVQPADPLELWKSPPFDPQIEEGRIFARGAADMKGNLLIGVIAVEALLAAEGKLPVNVKFLFEGQEEIGSRDLGAFVSQNLDLLACDLVLTPDGAQWGEEQPAMYLGTKGLCALQIDIETASVDLHSGLYGGAVPNAIHALTKLLGTLRDDEGRILVDGFFDQVLPISADEREKINEVPFDAEAYKSQIGIGALVGEPGYSTYERAWARPTLEVNGIWGGYQGDGVKTVIPAKAHAKITCRLVAKQDPDAVLDRLEAHILNHAPEGARVTVTRSVGKARSYLMPSDHPSVKTVAEVLTEEYGRAPYTVRVGGTLPIMDMFLQDLRAYTIVVGFAQDDEGMHSPNEFLRIADYERGQSVYAEMLLRLGQLEPAALAI